MRLLNSFLGALGPATVVGVVLFGTSALNAAPIPWATPSGSTNTYTYSDGNTDHQLFVPAGPGNQPVATDNGIVFTPTNFKAEAVGAAGQFDASSASDTVRFKIAVKPGHQLTDFSVHEVGDYSILGPAAVQMSAELVLSNMDTGEEMHQMLTPNPSGLTNGVTTGVSDWTADVDIPVPTGWKNVQVVLDDILHAVASPGGTSTIEKKFVGPGITITVIAPEPASIGLLALGSLAMLRRRRGA